MGISPALRAIVTALTALIALASTGAASAGEPSSRGAARRLVTVRESGPRVGPERARVRRYLIEVERGLRLDRRVFADRVESILSDRRSWVGGRGVALKRVASGPVAFRVAIASPRTTDRLCAPLPTNGIYSCFMRGRSVLNAMRWRRGAESYRRDLAGYRRYLVNHEVGHALGHGHAGCPGAGRKAPVMLQQTKGVRPCVRNPWPLARERR